MHKTRHAERRQNQRGMSDFIMTLIECYGRYDVAPGGAIRVHLGNREYQTIVGEIKWQLQQLDKARRGTLIVKADHLVTLYRRASEG